jgi:hypothetical protein
LGVSFGCNAIFDIERGTLRDDAEAGSGGVNTTGGKGGSSGKGGNGGKGGTSGSGTGGNGGSTGGSEGGNGGSTGGNGGSTGGNGGSTGGNGGGGKGGGAGTGGAAGTSGAAGNPGLPPIEPVDCMCSSTTPPDDELIHDFESGDPALLTRDGRNGTFYTLLSEASLTAELVCTGDDANCASLCMVGVLHGSSYPFAGIGLAFASSGGEAQSYDASRYEGVSFKIRGTVPDQARFRIEIPTVSTQPVIYSGTCDEDQGACVDHYKHYFPPPAALDAFETYEVSFANLGQGEGGGAWTAPWDGNTAFAWDASELLNMSFMVAASEQQVTMQDFHICIDDLRFLPKVTRNPVRNFDFETDASALNSLGNTMVASDQAEVAVGTASAKVDLSALTADGCGGFVSCANREQSDCNVTGCTWSGTSCTGTATDCGTLTVAQCTEDTGCHESARALFSVELPGGLDIQAGDRLAAWLRLPQGQIDWMHMFISASGGQWTTFPMNGSLKRDDWFYVEVEVPTGIPQPIIQWGFQLSVPTTGLSGSIYVDDMQVLR